MNRIRRYRFMAMALALCVAGAAAPGVLMAQGSPSFAAYGHSHKKHMKSSEAMSKKDMKKEEMSKKHMAMKSESKWHKKTESKWHKKEMGSKKMMESKKSEGHMAMMGHKPPHAGMVWVNTSSKVYHSSGSKYYGKTKHGKWMTAAEAQKAGYKAAKN